MLAEKAMVAESPCHRPLEDGLCFVVSAGLLKLPHGSLKIALFASDIAQGVMSLAKAGIQLDRPPSVSFAELERLRVVADAKVIGERVEESQP